MLSFSHQPSSTWGSPPGSSAEPGPRPLSQRLVAPSPWQMDRTPAPAAPVGAAGGEWGVLTVLLQPSSCPTITLLWAMKPKSPGTSPHINLLSSPIQPAAYLLWNSPWSQCTHQVQSQNQLPFCKQFPLLPSASQFHLLPGHPSQTPGVLVDTHPIPTTSQPSVPLGPPSQLSSDHSISHLSTWVRSGC